MSIQQEAYIGVECLNNFHSVLKRLNPRKVFLVRGKKSYQLSGAESVINDALIEFSPEVLPFSDFEENPKMEDVQKGLSYLEAFNPDIIIAIGGGSVLDISKLIRFFYSYDGNPIGTEFYKKKDLLPLLALPTTAGTGCEATHFAVMYKDKIKYSVEHDDVLPDYAFVYPPFTYNNPPYLTACTGFDALAQGIEAFWNVNATKESDEYAIKSIKLLWPNLPIAVNNPTNEIRNKVAEGAYWAGRAINITKTTAPHAFSYAFTTYYGIPHGHAVALTFPFFFELNSNRANKLNLSNNVNKYWKKIDNLKDLLCLPSDNVLNSFTLYINNIFPKHIRIDSSDKYLNLVNLERLKNNPILINNTIIEKIRYYLIQSKKLWQ